MSADAETACPPYPDDLDDTFAALSALACYDPAIVDGHILSSAVKILTAQEISEGGPYRTWLVGGETIPAWQDTDIVVNGTIGYFLSLAGVRLPALGRFIGEAIQGYRLTSPYYPGIFHVAYFLSRFYKNNISDGTAAARGALADIIRRRLYSKDDRDTTTLELAMAISSLINLEHAEKVTSSIADSLLKRLRRDGFLPYAFCIDPARDGKRCYAGTSALTAAFCAEALALCIDHCPSSVTMPKIPTLHSYICSLARSKCHDAGPVLSKKAIARIDKTTDEKITTLAYEFRDALYRNGTIVPAEIAEQLSLANLYGWMAYDIYDDALDHEGDPSLIPCANYFLRMLTEIYSTLAARIPDIIALFHAAMDRVDNANAWEQKYCRIPAAPLFGDRGMLADRSIGHAMGPLAELLFAGYGANSGEYKNAELFFHHYLIARQVHDDAHDWADDLLRGRVNSIGALVLAARDKEKYPGVVDIPMIAAAMPELRKLFWKEIIDEAVNIIMFHIAEARRARHASAILDGVDFMEGTLRGLESAARRALEERDKVVVFLADYKASLPSGAAF